MTRSLGFSCACIVVVAGLAQGQVTRESAKTVVTPGTGELRRVSQILGSTVALRETNEFGKVEDIVLNDQGCIEFVVVSHDNQYAMFPWGVGNWNFGQRVVTYDIAPNAVQPLFFAPNQWPNTTDPQFGRRMTDVFGPNYSRQTRIIERTRPALGGGTVTEERVKVKEKGR
jgi:sporulation protein YlmC with PRC-barrel domain